MISKSGLISVLDSSDVVFWSLVSVSIWVSHVEFGFTAPESCIEYDDDKDILIDNVINHVLAIAEAVVWFNPLIVADLDTTGADHSKFEDQ